MADVAQLYAERSAAVRDRLTAVAQKSWEALPDWSTGSNDAYAQLMSQTSSSAQQAIVNLVQSMVEHSTGTKAGLNADDLIGDATREGGHEDAWHIPMFSAWKAIGDGTMTPEEIGEQAKQDVATQALTDIAYTQRLAMKDLVGRDIIQGYRRVPAPGSACEFCTLIADQLYFTADLMEVHPGCSCSVAPADPSEVAAVRGEADTTEEEPPPEEPTSWDSKELERITSGRNMYSNAMDQYATLEGDEQQAWKNYVEEGFETMNRYLREGPAAFNDGATKADRFLMDRAKNDTDNLISAFKTTDYRTRKPLTLYRGEVKHYVGAPGDMLTESGVMSTSTDVDMASEFSGATSGAVVRIHVPPGQQYLLGNIAEDEIMLPPGMRFRIDKIDAMTGWASDVTILAAA